VFGPRAARGSVYLVGAGPGDPGLLTLRAHQLLQECDVVLFDALVSAEVLALARPGAERIDVGKNGHGPSARQPDINRLLVAHARARRRVVRLKGGDPLLFGRGSEEAEALADAGVPFEIVPGVSSVLAAPAYAGIPVTDRRYASSLAVVTAACATPGRAEDALSRAGGADTVVVLMGLSAIARVVDALVGQGRPPDTPVAAISAGTTPRQRTVVATLGTLEDAVRDARLTSPALLVVGEVVRLRARLAWFERRAAYSALSACIGSMVAARCAGMAAAVIAARPSTSAAADSITGSHGVTPKS
jgi:uroporphyrin-III C-methyltransferase